MYNAQPAYDLRLATDHSAVNGHLAVSRHLAAEGQRGPDSGVRLHQHVFAQGQRRSEGWSQSHMSEAPISSSLKAIRLGYEIYQTLPPAERGRVGARGRKLASFRKLAAMRGMPVSTLWRALAIYQLYVRFPELGSYRHLGVAHLSVILGVEDQYQLYFMRMAEIERWSRRRLDHEIRSWQAYVSGAQVAPRAES